MTEPTVEEVIRSYIATRDKISALEKAHKAALEPLKEGLEKAERWLAGKMLAEGETSKKTKAGVCFFTTKESATVADREEFLSWVQADWESRKSFLENRVAKGEVKQLIEDGEQPPPGVNFVSIQSVNVRRS